MNTTSPADAAAWLHTVAELLGQAAPVPLRVTVSLGVSEYRTSLTEAERVAAVDGLASALGLSTQPAKNASFWEHVVKRSDGAFYLSVGTDIARPRICACGKACAHAQPTSTVERAKGDLRWLATEPTSASSYSAQPSLAR
ncbi:MAG TPA: hypothetical protein VFB74_05860 [Kribbellaceae bacterium]|nr:hypothetical protein [Kribbellaceae bacterium]